MTALGCDPAGTLTFVNALNATAATAGGTGDEDAANGAGIDLAGLPARFNGAAFVVRANATLAQGKKLTVSAKIQDSANGTTWADLVAAAPVEGQQPEEQPQGEGKSTRPGKAGGKA